MRIRARIQLFFLNAYPSPDPDPGSGSWILVRLRIHKQLHFYMKNVLKVGSMSKNIPIKAFWKSIKQNYYLLFWSVSMLPDPDPHFQYGSGSKTANSMRIRIHKTGFFFIHPLGSADVRRLHVLRSHGVPHPSQLLHHRVHFQEHSRTPPLSLTFHSTKCCESAGSVADPDL